MTLIFALLAGVLTIAAPCTLPVLPILLGSSVRQTSPLRPIFLALGFVTSFASAVLVFSAITEVIGIDQDTLRTSAAVLLIGFGLLMLWPWPFEWLAAEAGSFVRPSLEPSLRTWTGNAGGFLLGTSLGLVWTPCAGPVLASILTVIAASADFERGALLLLLYSLGAAIPMLAIAYGGQFVTSRTKNIARIAPHLQRIFGVVTILFAVAMYYQYDADVTAWFSGFYPGGQTGL